MKSDFRVIHGNIYFLNYKLSAFIAIPLIYGLKKYQTNFFSSRKYLITHLSIIITEELESNSIIYHSCFNVKFVIVRQGTMHCKNEEKR